MAKHIRVLIYEGSQAWIDDQLRRNEVRPDRSLSSREWWDGNDVPHQEAWTVTEVPASSVLEGFTYPEEGI